jgi:hypothetical protein
LTPNAVEPGAFQDHFDNMRRGATHDEEGTTRPAATIIKPTSSTQPLTGVTVTEPTPPTPPAPRHQRMEQRP